MSRRSVELNQMSVSRDPEKNKHLSNQDRIENLESDIVHITDAIERLVKQNDKYADYLESRIRAEHARTDFWLDVRKKLVTSGIWGTFTLVVGALFYAASQYIKTH